MVKLAASTEWMVHFDRSPNHPVCLGLEGILPLPSGSQCQDTTWGRRTLREYLIKSFHVLPPKLGTLHKEERYRGKLANWLYKKGFCLGSFCFSGPAGVGKGLQDDKGQPIVANSGFLWMPLGCGCWWSPHKLMEVAERYIIAFFTLLFCYYRNYRIVRGSCWPAGLSF